MDLDFPIEEPVALVMATALLMDLSTQTQSSESEEDDLDDIFFEPPPPKSKSKPAPKPVSRLEFPWLAQGHCMITHRKEALTTPFSRVSDEVQKDLEKAEKTKGGLQRVLTALKGIGRKVANKEAISVFKSDNKGEEGGTAGEASESVLECVCRILVTEAAIQQSMLKKKHKAKPIRQMCNFGLIPPGGVLGTIGIPGEIVPTRDHLHIQEYSNKVYWKFAPYLESVRHVLESLTPINAVLTSSARTSEYASKLHINPTIKGFMMCRLKASKSSMRSWWRA